MGGAVLISSYGLGLGLFGMVSFYLQSFVFSATLLINQFVHVYIPLKVLETADRLLVNARGLFNNAVGGRLCVSYIQLQTSVRVLLLPSSSSRWSSFPCFSSPNVLFSVTSPFVARAVIKSKSQVLNFYLKISIFMHALSVFPAGVVNCILQRGPSPNVAYVAGDPEAQP